MRRLLQILVICLVVPTVLLAQENPPAAKDAAKDNPLSVHAKFLYGAAKKILLQTAENMPEENFSYKPVDSVRSFGQIVGHVADAQYLFCSAMSGAKNPRLGIEKTKTSKADLIAALNDAFSYCDKAYEGLTDASAAEKVKFMGGDTPKLGVLYLNNMHSVQHYGNLVTYMRMKNVVPPTSDPVFMQSLMK